MPLDQAGTRFADLAGTIAIDGNDGPPLSELARACGVQFDGVPVAMAVRGTELHLEFWYAAMPPDGDLAERLRGTNELDVYRLRTQVSLTDERIRPHIRDLDAIVYRKVLRDVEDQVVLRVHDAPPKN